jgi:chemotaxis signal transduction protein
MGKPDGRDATALCLFTCGRRPLAVPLEAVAEVVELDRLVPMPLCPPRVVGLCALRRDVVPVVRLGDEEAGGESGHVALLLRAEPGPWGILIDRDGVAVTDDGHDHRDGPPTIADGVAVVGAVERGGASHAVLDPAETARVLRDEIERWYGQARERAG